MTACPPFEFWVTGRPQVLSEKPAQPIQRVLTEPKQKKTSDTDESSKIAELESRLAGLLSFHFFSSHFKVTFRSVHVYGVLSITIVIDRHQSRVPLTSFTHSPTAHTEMDFCLQGVQKWVGFGLACQGHNWHFCFFLKKQNNVLLF